MESSFLSHHGILGQKWGVQNGPPYPLKGGDYSPSEKQHKYKKKHLFKGNYNKKHIDEVLKKDKTTIQTLSHDPNRTKNTDMFYGTHTFQDNHQYNAFFNTKTYKPIYDEKGKEIGTGQSYKFKIKNSLNKDMKVASEDSGNKSFMKLYKNDRDFYNFVNDKNRLEKYAFKKWSSFKGYKEAWNALHELQNNKGKNVSEEDLKKVYRLFNYAIPYDGDGKDKRGSKDVLTQRAKWFKELKKDGYGAVLDTNDSIYNHFGATSSIIVFDMDSIVPKEVKQSSLADKNISIAINIGRRALNIK